MRRSANSEQMKELQKVIATVKGFIANYDYQSLKPAEISIRVDSVELSGTDVLRYTITVQGGKYMFASGDSFKTALQRLEIDFRNVDKEPVF